jgi:hypothetical protein
MVVTIPAASGARVLGSVVEGIPVLGYGDLDPVPVHGGGSAVPVAGKAQVLDHREVAKRGVASAVEIVTEAAVVQGTLCQGWSGADAHPE